jgi:hypothetical protein
MHDFSDGMSTLMGLCHHPDCYAMRGLASEALPCPAGFEPALRAEQQEIHERARRGLAELVDGVAAGSGR